MVRSEVVEQQYRLQVRDLPEGRLEATISGVSYQGLEHMQPVLHFYGYTKSLVLSRLLCLQIVELTGSVVAEDWIGRRIRLQSVADGAEAYISIDINGRFRSRQWMRSLQLVRNVPMFLRIGLFILLLGLVSLVYTLQNWDHISSVLSRMFP